MTRRLSLLKTPLLLLMIALLIAGCGSGDSGPQSSSAATIAFICGQASQTQNQQLCVIRTDGTGFKKLLDVDVRARPSINIHGEIAFACLEDEICVIKSDRTGLKVLTDDDAVKSNPSINQYGQIAFVCNAERRTDRSMDEICIINADGTGLRQLTNNTSQDGFPSINDRGEIAYQCEVRICTINSDGSDFRELTDNQMSDFEPVLNNSGQIAFKCRDDAAKVWICSLDPQIGQGNVIELSGTRSTFDLNDEGIIAADCIVDNVANEICTFDFEGALLKRLTDNDTIDTAPSINNAGTISFDCGGAGFELRLCVIKSDGSNFNEFDVESVRTNYAAISD